METTEPSSPSPVKKTIGRAVTVLLWAIIAGGVFFGLSWSFRLWPAILMSLTFVPVMIAAVLAVGVSSELGKFLGRKLAEWSDWDRKMSEGLCFLIIVIIAISPVLWFTFSSVFHDWCVAVWNFGLTLPYHQSLS